MTLYSGGGFMYFDLIFLILFLCCYIPAWVFCVLGWQVSTFKGISVLSHEKGFLEFFWTVIPTGAIGIMCLLNLQFLVVEQGTVVGDVVKVVGRQWYWTYEPLDREEFDSLMTDFVTGVDKPLRVFYGDPCHFLVTSADVIHSFSVPDACMKVDAIPGRVNQHIFYPDRMGVLSGYCTELCGAGHAYMPVVLEVVQRRIFF